MGLSVAQNRHFTCGQCRARFARASNLKRHLEKHEPKKHRCPSCRKLFRELRNAQDHINNHRCVRKRPSQFKRITGLPTVIRFQTPPAKKSLDEQTSGGPESPARVNHAIEDTGAEYQTGQHIFEDQQQSSNCNPSKVSTSSSGEEGGSTSPRMTHVEPISDPLLTDTESDPLGCGSVPDGISSPVLFAAGTDSKCHHRTVQELRPLFSPSSHHHTEPFGSVHRNILAVPFETSPGQGAFPRDHLNCPVNHCSSFEGLPGIASQHAVNSFSSFSPSSPLIDAALYLESLPEISAQCPPNNLSTFNPCNTLIDSNLYLESLPEISSHYPPDNLSTFGPSNPLIDSALYLEGLPEISAQCPPDNLSTFGPSGPLIDSALYLEGLPEISSQYQPDNLSIFDPSKPLVDSALYLEGLQEIPSQYAGDNLSTSNPSNEPLEPALYFQHLPETSLTAANVPYFNPSNPLLDSAIYVEHLPGISPDNVTHASDVRQGFPTI